MPPSSSRRCKAGQRLLVAQGREKGYLGHYARDFRDAQGLSGKAWEEKRAHPTPDQAGQHQSGPPGNVKGGTSVEGNRATVKLRRASLAQRITSSNKTLNLINQDGKWVIQRGRLAVDAWSVSSSRAGVAALASCWACAGAAPAAPLAPASSDPDPAPGCGRPASGWQARYGAQESGKHCSGALSAAHLIRGDLLLARTLSPPSATYLTHRQTGCRLRARHVRPQDLPQSPAKQLRHPATCCRWAGSSTRSSSTRSSRLYIYQNDGGCPFFDYHRPRQTQGRKDPGG